MSKRSIIIVAVAILAAVALGIGAFFIIKGKNSNENKSSDSDNTYIFYGEDNEVEDIWSAEEWNQGVDHGAFIR